LIENVLSLYCNCLIFTATMIITVTTTKGGAGKTTIAINLAVAYAHQGKEVCIIDTDTDQYSSIRWSNRRDEEEKDITVIRVGEDKLIKEAYKFSKKFDVVIIDGRPTMSDSLDSAVVACDVVIIPVSPSVLELDAFQDFIPRVKKIKDMREGRNESDTLIAFAVLNGLDSKSNISKEIGEAIRAITNKNDYITLLDSKIYNRVAYRNSLTGGLGVLEEGDPKAKGEIQALIKELDSKLKNK
jgi:chromosome partitioning protein